LAPQRRRSPALLAAGGIVGLVLVVACEQVPKEPAAAYAKLCQRCHGADGHGNPAIPIDPQKVDLRNSDTLRRRDREGVRAQIANGKGAMPAFGKRLTAEQLEGLTAYALALLPDRATAPGQPLAQ
jgi:cytochrome c6